VNDTRTGILELLAQMGANVAIGNESVTSGEPVADMRVRFGELHAADIGGSVVVRAIDEFPILTVAATQSAGKTTVRDAKELRVKEVDRIAVLARELAKMGVVMNQHDDGYSLLGPIRPTGAVVDSHDDHRLGMSLAIMGLVATSPTTVLNAGCVEDSFPGFTETMQALGANMAWE
jgi:3-phosphoshikimate 1-carboxyvinyltransferase